MMSRRAYTLAEALMAILILAFGILGLLAFIIVGVRETVKSIRTCGVSVGAENALALLRLYAPTLAPNFPPPANGYVWLYQLGRSPPVGASFPPNIPYTRPDPLLQMALDIEGPYESVQINPEPRPVLTGRRVSSPDPVRYTWALAIRLVPSASPDKSLVDVSVVVFEDFDSTDPNMNPYVLTTTSGANVTISMANPFVLQASGPIRTQPLQGVILDAQNGYAYRVSPSGEIVPPARANSNLVYHLPKAVDVIELGILDWRRP